jgi:hypothetical protein
MSVMLISSVNCRIMSRVNVRNENRYLPIAFRFPKEHCFLEVSHSSPDCPAGMSGYVEEDEYGADAVEAGGSRSTRSKSCTSATSSTANLTRTNLGSNPLVHVQRECI